MKKGFTLIELLAVIVILAIISLIAIPIAINIIEDTKEKAILRSADFYLDAVEMSIGNATLNNKKISNGTYNIMENGNICLIYENDNCTNELKVELDGEYPTSGTIGIINGKILLALFVLNNKEVGKYGKGGFDFVDNETYKPGTPIYFNVTTGKLCIESEAVSDTGIKNGCMKFYVIKDLGGALNLILDHNTTLKIKWINSTDYIETGGNQTDWDNGYRNMYGPVTLIKQLYNDTKDWKGTEIPLDYTMDQRGQKSNAYYTIEYSKTPNMEGAKEPYKARIISAQEIAEITGNIIWDERKSNGWYFFETLKPKEGTACTDNNASTECKYGWLYDNTEYCIDYGCNTSDSSNKGYWTVSSDAQYTNYAWHIRPSGHIRSYLGDSGQYGIRPVITISKTNLT